MENEILNYAKTDNAVKAKALIEIINSLDCTAGHIEYLQKRTGWLARLKDTITGDNFRRQNQIDENLAHGLRHLWDFATDIRLNQTRLAKYGTKLANDILLLQENMTIVGEKLLQIDKELTRFRNSITSQLERLEANYDRLSTIQQGRLHLDACASRLKLGYYSRFSLPGQLCHVVAELSYGPFHDAISKYPDCRKEMLDIAAGALCGVLGELLKRPPFSPQPWRVWQPQKPDTLEKEIICYLTGPFNLKERPITAHILDPEHRNTRVPAFIAPNSLATRVLAEMLDQE